MAQQESIIKQKGKIGGLSFYKTKEGYQARAKGGVDGDRIKNELGYQRTRENNGEFAAVTRALRRRQAEASMWVGFFKIVNPSTQATDIKSVHVRMAINERMTSYGRFYDVDVHGQNHDRC